MNNLIFSLNATMPVFLMMVLGFILKQIGIIDDSFASKMNKFVFAIPLPCLLFSQLSTVDFASAWNTNFVLFCFVSTAICILTAFLLSFLIRKKSLRGEFVQASYRSSAALLGIAFIQNIYGNTGFAPLMIIGSVPLYNIMAVIVLSLTAGSESPGKLERRAVTKAFVGIVTNPIIIGISIGLLWSALKIPVPYILDKTVSSVGAVATPMGLIAMGASLDMKKALSYIRPALSATFMKLIGFASMILPFAVILGFRDAELVAILIMLTSATTVSSYVMAKNMGHEGTLTGGVVMLTTVFSAFTITLWIFILKTLGMI